MADTKISALTSASTPLAGTEVVPLVQSSTTKKVAVSDLTAGRAVSAASYSATGNVSANLLQSNDSGITVNGVAYFDANKIIRGVSGLTYDGANMNVVNGKLGVGTSSFTPNASIAIRDNSGGSQLRIRGTDSTARLSRIQFEDYNGTLADGLIDFKIPTAGSASSAILQLGVNSAAMTLDASGYLLVNTTSTSPGYGDTNTGVKLSNSGSNFSRAAADYVITVNQNTSDGGTYYQMNFRQNNTGVGSITSTASATAYNTSSDYRLKNVTGPITNSGAYIDSLNPVEGTWNVDGSPFVGLIAHEVQSVSRTQIVVGAKDGEQMQAMDYSSAEIIANLIAEVKSLRTRIAALEAK